jgi:hypothetical protein
VALGTGQLGLDLLGVGESVELPTYNTLLSTVFTGTNGAAWPSPWTTSLQSGSVGGAIDIQSNRGRMRANDGGYRRARASATGVAITDGTFEATFNLQGVEEQFNYLWFRTTGDWLSGEEWHKLGYALYLGGNPDAVTDLAIIRLNGVGSSSAIADASPFAWQAGVDYKAKISFVGSSLRAKVWLASQSEPAGWTLEGTDATYTSGGIDISLLSGASGADRQWIVDDILVTTSASGSSLTPNDARHGHTATSPPLVHNVVPPTPTNVQVAVSGNTLTYTGYTVVGP